MKFIDGTVGRSKRKDPNLQGLKNIPAHWNLGSMITLYGWDWETEGKYEMPSKQAIRKLATEARDYEYCLIDIEGWTLVKPGSWTWRKWNEGQQPGGWELPADMKAVADTASEFNQVMVDQRIELLTEWRKTNDSTKLAWWNWPSNCWNPQVSSYTNENQEDNYRGPKNYRGDDQVAYSGSIGTYAWGCEQTKELLDFGYVSGYDVEWPKQEHYNMQRWTEAMQNAKSIADAAMSLPLMIGFCARPIQKSWRETWWHNPERLSYMIDVMDTILRSEDAIAWWEGGRLEELDAQLSTFQQYDDLRGKFANEYWINAFDKWITSHGEE